MKKLIITIKPQHLCNILNGIKTIEARKNKNLANAVKKLIAENGECHIKCACSKSTEFDLDNDGREWFCWDKKSHHYPFKNLHDYYNGNIVCEIVVDKVEDIEKVETAYINGKSYTSYELKHMNEGTLCNRACLKWSELWDYFYNAKTRYALHIKSAIPYEKPQENKRVIQNFAWVEE